MASGRLMDYDEAHTLGIVQQVHDFGDDASFNAAVRPAPPAPSSNTNAATRAPLRWLTPNPRASR